MKVLIPLEIPDGTYEIKCDISAEAPDELRCIDCDFTEGEIANFIRFAKLFETEIIKNGIL